MYEFEREWFFVDHSMNTVTDDLLIRLVNFPNVVLTAHMAALHREAHT